MMKTQYERIVELEREVKLINDRWAEAEILYGKALQLLKDKNIVNADGSCACGGQGCGPTYQQTKD